LGIFHAGFQLLFAETQSSYNTKIVFISRVPYSSDFAILSAHFLCPDSGTNINIIDSNWLSWTSCHYLPIFVLLNFLCSISNMAGLRTCGVKAVL